MDSLLFATVTFGIGYFGGKFVGGLVKLWQSTAVPTVVPVIEIVEPEPVIEAVEPVVEPVAVEPEPAVVETIVEATPVVQKGVRELRIDCGKAGVTWKNAHGKGKHLKKAEMEAALRKA
ncbi:MAG: hypothetical protein RBJ76_13390 [Stenomitos frigidus ULC029]